MTVEEILQSMVDRKEALGLSYQKIGDRAGYCASGAHHAMRQSGNPRIATVCDLMEALGLEIRVVEKEGGEGARSDNAKRLLRLIAENPGLPVIPMVDSEVVADDGGYWMGKWGHAEVTEYYLGRDRVHFKDDDEEDVLSDLADGKGYGKDREGRDIYELPDEEWDALVRSIPWTKVIAVYITT